jgi:sugar lactone lactonase YvrE
MRPLLAVALIAAPVALVGSADPPAGKLEVVAELTGDMPTGVTVSKAGRVFVTFPRWQPGVAVNVAELRDGRPVPFPSAEWNTLDLDHPDRCLLTVQSAVVDPLDRLWLCDTGTVNMEPVVPGGAKLLCVDLATNKVVKTLPLAGPGVLKTTYLNDIRFDLRRAAEGVAFVTDSADRGPNGIVVIDLATGATWRRLNDHPSTKAEPGFVPTVEGKPVAVRPRPDSEPKPLGMGTDGIALSDDGKRLFYCPLASRKLYAVSADALADPSKTDAEVAATVEDLGDRGFASDGLEHDDRGNLYLTDYEHNAVRRRSADGRYAEVARDDRLLWPDTLAVGRDGYLYVTASQLHRQGKFQGGTDCRQKPYLVFRQKIDAGPVLLTRK